MLYMSISSVAIYLSINLFAHFQYADMESFFMDDVGLFNTFQWKKGFWDFISLGKDNKFRPFSDTFLYLGYKLIGLRAENAYLYVLFIGALVCALLTLLIVKCFGKIWYGILFSCLFSITRFAYYSISQYFGVMESITTLCAVCTLLAGIRFMESDDNNACRRFVVVNIAAILCIFSHERYLTLYGYLLLLVFFKFFFSKKSVPYYGVIILSIIAMLVFRKVYLGPLSFQGTGGTNLLDTFSITSMLGFVVQGIVQIFGWNMGPGFLVGITMDQAAPIINLLPIGIIAIFVGMLLALLYQSKATHHYGILWTWLSIVSFIGATITSGCITIRLELRWLYIPYLGFLVLLFWMASNIQFSGKYRWCCAESILTVLLVLIFPIDSYYRTGWKYNYLGEEFLTNNAVYECAIRKYGAELYDRPIVIIEDNDEVKQDFDVMASLYYMDKSVTSQSFPSLDEVPQELLQQNPVILYAIDLNNICDVTGLIVQ